MIFVDTGAWIAQFSRRDQFHRRGADLLEKLRQAGMPLATSTPVLYETISFLGRRIGAATAIKARRQILGWKSLLLLRPEPADEAKALMFMAKFADQAVRHVDCLSFAMMRRERIATAFAFDRHFSSAGFRVIPEST